MNPTEIQSALQRAQAYRNAYYQSDTGAEVARDGLTLSDDVEALAQALQKVTSERDFLKRREQSIIEATEPADGGQYRADIAGAIERQRRQLDEARAEIAALRLGAQVSDRGELINRKATAGAALVRAREAHERAKPEEREQAAGAVDRATEAYQTASAALCAAGGP